MFLDYYGFREQPFGVTPDLRYLYFSNSHREALASLYYGLETGRAFLLLIAPPGMGKTTLLRQLLEQMRSSAQTVFLFQTQCTSRELLRYVLVDLGVKSPARDLVEMHEQLKEALLGALRSGRRLVLVIDEAQGLEDSALELIRLLSNFETSQSKLMQIVLSGQPTLADRLGHCTLDPLRQRISIISRLHPFGLADTTRYVEHRLRVAGYTGRPLFLQDALPILAKHSHGIPRIINNLCFNALTLAYAEGQALIDASIMARVAADLDLDGHQPESCSVPAAIPVESGYEPLSAPPEVAEPVSVGFSGSSPYQFSHNQDDEGNKRESSAGTRYIARLWTGMRGLRAGAFQFAMLGLLSLTAGFFISAMRSFPNIRATENGNRGMMSEPEKPNATPQPTFQNYFDRWCAEASQEARELRRKIKELIGSRAEGPLIRPPAASRALNASALGMAPTDTAQQKTP